MFPSCFCKINLNQINNKSKIPKQTIIVATIKQVGRDSEGFRLSYCIKALRPLFHRIKQNKAVIKMVELG